MKLIQTHTSGIVHKSAKGRPCCASRKKGLFSDYVALYEFDGEEEQVTCKRCLAKIKKYKNKRK